MNSKAEFFRLAGSTVVIEYTDYESTWQMQLQVPTGAHLLETVTKLEVSRANTGAIPRQA